MQCLAKKVALLYIMLSTLEDASTMFLHSMGYVKDNQYIGHVLSSGGGLKMATNAVGTVTVSVDGSSASSVKQVFIFIPQIDDAVKS